MLLHAFLCTILKCVLGDVLSYILLVAMFKFFPFPRDYLSYVNDNKEKM